jgi:protocadherin Fat 1/2/3
MLETLAPLDREFTPYYWLTVLAVDRGSVPLSAVTEVYIEVTDINDNIPSMSRPVFYPSVKEDAPLGTSVLQLEAWDPDFSSQGKLTFNLTSGNHMGHFIVHPFTGEAQKAGGTGIYRSTKQFLGVFLRWHQGHLQTGQKFQFSGPYTRPI